jgi:hypothetical protein
MKESLRGGTFSTYSSPYYPSNSWRPTLLPLLDGSLVGEEEEEEEEELFDGIGALSDNGKLIYVCD